MSSSTLIPIVDKSQVGQARRSATEMASSLGFDETHAAKAAIVASELATNLIKHTKAGGSLILQSIPGGEGNGLEIISVDQGAGMSDPQKCISDGYSTSDTMGTGLGAVRRLSDEFNLYSRAGGGTIAVARMFPEAHSEHGTPMFDVGAISVPKVGETVNGDRWAFDLSGYTMRLVLADGLGHGLHAAEAAQKATRTFDRSSAQEPDEVIRSIHEHLKGTRGAAVGAVCIDRRTHECKFSGLGNVAGLVDAFGDRRYLMSNAGTAGFGVQKISKLTFAWPLRGVLILYTDGLSGHFNLDKYEGLQSQSASAIAATIYRDFGKSHDDATVIVVKASN